MSEKQGKPKTGASAPGARAPLFNWPVIQTSQNAHALALQYQFEESQWWPEARLVEHQLRRIEGVIGHAARTVPFYRDRLAAVAGLAPGALSLEAFREIPPFRRADIQDAGEALVSRAPPKGHGPPFQVRSSGSIGRPIEVQGTALTSLFVKAFTLRGHLWHKRDLSAKNVEIRTAYAAGKTPENVKWAPVVATGRSVRLDIARPINELYDALLREAPAYLQTHPNVLMGLIERSQEIGVQPAGLREARTYGEPLEPRVRDAAREHWQVPVVDNYSAMETGTIAHQCPETTNLHVQAEGVLVEVLDDAGRPCRPGETGRVVLTALHNFATPLIRYDIGDFARVGAACPCGRGLPVLESVVGRERELLIYPSGDRQFAEVRPGGLDQFPEIRQFQLTQKTVERIEVKLAVSSPLAADREARLRALLTERLRHPFDYDVVYVDEIARAANGKFFEFLSEVGAPATHGARLRRASKR